MRQKLKTFIDFANSLLPHETHYLKSLNNLEDPERISILDRVDHNARNIYQFTPYDTKIDKRKYNHLKTWITKNLDRIDVDRKYEWIHQMERKVMTDSISPSDEKAILREIRDTTIPSHNFIQFYELLLAYRHFLLIRLRYESYDLVVNFIDQYQESYQLCKQTNEKIHQATVDIVGQYSGEGADSEQWVNWLKEVIINENIDGHNRYLALVRLVFIAHNYKRFEDLAFFLDLLDRKFKSGEHYSKRLLANYYNIRLMMHTHQKELDEAAYFGHLAIRSENHDYILYLNNLCAVLLRSAKYQEALDVMKKSSQLARKTKNMHNRIGYVAFYIESLIKNSQYLNAVNYASSFLQAYSKDILTYRWHLFFTKYLESLLLVHQYDKVIKVVNKYKLMDRDQSYKNKSQYEPTIPIAFYAAQKNEGVISDQVFKERIQELINEQSDQLWLLSPSPGLREFALKWGKIKI